MKQIKLRDNFKCKYPDIDPVHSCCQINEYGLCNIKCSSHGVCGVCDHYHISHKNEECLDCKFNEDILNDPNIIAVSDEAERDLIKAVKEKDGFINGNNIKL